MDFKCFNVYNVLFIRFHRRNYYAFHSNESICTSGCGILSPSSSSRKISAQILIKVNPAIINLLLLGREIFVCLIKKKFRNLKNPLHKLAYFFIMFFFSLKYTDESMKLQKKTSKCSCVSGDSLRKRNSCRLIFAACTRLSPSLSLL